jgi:hypothetical protein
MRLAVIVAVLSTFAIADPVAAPIATPEFEKKSVIEPVIEMLVS